MLLEPLVSTIETIKGRIQQYNPELRQSEALARYALIDPILCALGWDTADPALVRPEYPVSRGQADYALLGTNGSVTAFVEAKTLGRSLEQDQDIDQLVRYAFTDGIPYAVLTNGNDWHVYDLTIPGVAIKDRRMLELSIADSPAYETALKLLLLWRSNIASGQPVAASPPMAIVGDNAVQTLDMPVANTAPVAGSPTPETLTSGDWIPLSRIDNVTGKKAPVAIKFSDGETRRLRAWWQLLVESAEFLGRNGRLTIDHCPIDAGRGWRFINSVPHSPNGRNYITPKQLSSGIYMETHLSSKAIVSYSNRLLAHFGVSAETVELQFE